MSFIPSFRLLVVCFSAFAASLPMAWVSLAKLMLFITCLIFLIFQLVVANGGKFAPKLWAGYAILAAVLAFAVSLFWSVAPSDVALVAFTKHSKLLEVLLLISLIRTEREARLGVIVFLLGQALFLASSWAMAAGWQIPWASSDWATEPRNRHVVYSSYLDQSILFATSAAIFWHLRGLWPRWRYLATMMAALGATNALFLLEGRTGYTVALTMLTMAIVWAIPKKMRLIAVLIVPVMILAAAYSVSTKISQRLSDVVSESQSYAHQGRNESSSGFRLNAWKRSLQAISEEPLMGRGVGSWTVTIKQLEGPSALKVFGAGNASNPHQEYLLWGVELGVGGIMLLLAIFWGGIRDALGFVQPVMRSTLSLLASAATACLFNSALYDALVGDYFCVALGLLFALGLHSSPVKQMTLPKAVQ